MQLQLRSFIKTIFRVTLRVAIVVLVLLVLIIICLRLPYVQNKLAQRATTYLSERIGTEVSLNKIYLTYDIKLALEDLYVEAESGDTLISTSYVELGANLWPLLNKEVHLRPVILNNSKVNIQRQLSGRSNYDFIIEAFESDTVTSADQPNNKGSTLQIVPGSINIKLLELRYYDQMDSLFLDIDVGQLRAKPTYLDLQTLTVHAKSIDLTDTKFNVADYSTTISEGQSIDSQKSSDLSSHFKIEELLIQNVEGDYHSAKDTFSSTAVIDYFSVTSIDAQLANQIIDIKDVVLNNSEVAITMPGQSQDSEPSAIEWPLTIIPFTDWKVKVGAIAMTNNGFTLNTPSESEDHSKEMLGISIEDIDIEDIHISEQSAGLSINQLSLSERQGFHIQGLTGHMVIDTSEISINNLDLILPNSQITGRAHISYGGIKRAEDLIFDLECSDCIIHPDDLNWIGPKLTESPHYKTLSKKPLYADLKASGQLNNIELDRLLLAWGRETTLSGSGLIKGLPNTDNLYVNIPNLKVQSQKEGIQLFIEEEIYNHLPDQMVLKADIKGGLSKLVTDAKLETNKGIVNLQAQYQEQDGIQEFSGSFDADELDSGYYSGEEEWTTAHLSGDFEGSGTDLESLILSAEIQVNRLPYADAEFCETTFRVNGKAREFTIDIISDESFFETKSSFILNLDTLAPSYEANIDIQSLQLKPLRLHDEFVDISVIMTGQFNGTIDQFTASTTIMEGQISLEKEVFRIDPLNAQVESNATSFYSVGASDWLEWRIVGNAQIDKIVSGIDEFISLDTLSHSAKDREIPINVEGSVFLLNDPIISDVLLPNLEDFENSGLKFNFNEASGELNADWLWSYIIYDDIRVDNALLSIRSDGQFLDYSIGFDELSREDIQIFATRLFGEVDIKERHLSATFENKSSNNDLLVNISSDICFFQDSIVLHLYPDQTIINKKEWTIPTDNSISYLDKRLIIKDFILESDNQSLELYTIDNKEDDHLGLQFSNFQITSLTAMLNEDAPPVEGTIIGNILIEDLFSFPGFEANMFIEDLVVLDEKLGLFSIRAEGTDDRRYSIETTLRDGPVLFEGNGFYDISGDLPKGEVLINLEEAQVSILNKLMADDIKDADGLVKGRINLYQENNKLSYDGQLVFEDATFTIITINENFTLRQETIDIAGDKINFDQFKIVNSENQESVISGYIDLKDLDDIGLSLKVSAENFRLINSTVEDNNLFYGKVFVDFDCDISGTIDSPILSAKTRLNEGTNVTFIVPEEQLDVIEKEGVVIFVNMNNGQLDDIDEEQLAVSDITSIDLNAVLQVDSSSILRVVVDERSGDFIQVRGEADLNFSLAPNGRMTLSGIYSVNEGRYELNLYDLVRRRFELVPGSNIVWSGDPYNAQLDLRALYRVKTAPLELMAPQLSGTDASVRTSYRQELPFEVYLNIENELIQPEVSFSLDMPESHRNALSGNVYSRILQINESESELNKQVFSLMVLNRFMSYGITGGTTGGASAIARSSVSQVLTNQLNSLSDRYIQGVELDFGLDSYKDYQTGSALDRTQLSVQARKSLLDDRLIIMVGNQIDLENNQSFNNQNATDLIGDISIEYLITEDGRYRVKGFRKNEFEGMVEGLLIVAGVAVSYRREFDRLSELWSNGKQQETNDSQPATDTLNIQQKR